MITSIQKLLGILYIFLFFFNSLSSQTSQIKGTVSGSDELLAFATIMLKNASDSALIKAEVTDENGQFRFTELNQGVYFIEASYVGYQTYQSSTLTVKQDILVLEPITLNSVSAALAEVVVVAEKPIIEVLADKTVFNVDKTLNSTGTNGFELLRKAPGVIIDNNNNVILDGKTGVQIFIDGKASILAGEDLNNYLQSLQSTDIEAIEIITQPSSKYDAAGNAGIINIRLKKDKRLGTNGTLSSGYAYGRNSRYNSSLSFNNRTRQTNFFGTYSNSLGNSWSFINLDRIQQNVRYDSRTETLSDRATHNVKLGWDLFPKANHTFGILVNGNFFNSTASDQTNTPITRLESGNLEQILIANNKDENDNYNLNGNLNYRFADTLGHELLVDFDYGRYNRDRTSFQPNEYRDGTSNSTIFERNFRMITPTQIDVITAKIDYSQSLFGGQIGIGAKYSNVSTDNDFQFFDVVDENDQFNANRSNQFLYTEVINAAYLNFSRKWSKWNLQFGLRAEQTISEGDLIQQPSQQQ